MYIVYLAMTRYGPDCSIILRNMSGKIDFPTKEECDNNTIVANNREWEILLKEGEFAYLRFEKTSIKCFDGTLTIKTSGKNLLICGSGKLGNYFFPQTVFVFMQRMTTNCSLARISFVYYRFNLKLTMSSHHVQPGQSVQFVARLNGADSLKAYLKCSVKYEGKSTLAGKNFSTIFSTLRSFQYPGSYSTYVQCNILEEKKTFDTAEMDFYVECALSSSTLQISFKETSTIFHNPVELVSRHRYCFPISYSLLLDDVIVVENQTEQNLNEMKFLLKAFVDVNYKVNSSMQQLIGPGIHDVTLLLQNNVSSVMYFTMVTLNEEIKDFNVTVKEFVGFHPHYFIINATVSQGAPISLSVQIKSIESNLSHFNGSLFCPHYCHSMVIKTNLSQPGMYKVEAIAKNDISQSSSWALIEALPQIYNVFISSLKPIPSYSRNYVYAFVKGDIGDYLMTIYLQGRPENHSFTISKLEYDHKDLPSLPFDAKFYKLIKIERVLYHIGMQQVTGFIRNSKQSFPFVGWVDVLETSSCLEDLRIRDGNYQGGFENPLKVFDYLTFSVDFKFTCKNMSEVRYKWLVFPVATDMDMATYTYEVEFEKESFEPELIIRADTLSPGLYVIKVKVTSENVTSDVLEGKLKDYTLIEITKKKLYFVILGGNVLQTDNNNMTLLRFESSIDHNKYHGHISYNWFCSIKQEELPTRTVIGKIQRKDSCFDWHTLWVTSGHVMEISMNELRQSEHYYIRLIISGPHYDATYADQEVVVQARQAPIVNLKCWSNCGKYFSPHLSIILHLECDDCLRRKWTLSPNPGHQLPLCDDQEFCKLNASLLIPSSNVTGTGYNIHGENSSVTIFLNALSSHGGGSCIILPSMGSAYTTKFNVTCAGYIEGKYQLMYKFFLQEKGHRYLLQYGFDPVLYDIILPPGRSYNDVTIVVEICTLDQSCVEENLFVTVVTKDDVNDDVINELDAALLSSNLQRIAQFVLVLSSSNKLNQSKRKEIISKMAEYPMLLLEPVKQVADVISHVTNNPKLLEETQLQDVQDILDRVESFVPFSASRYDDVNFIVRSCMTTTSQLMRLVRFYPFKNEENLRMNRLGKLLMASLTPGEEVISFETKSVEGRLLKLNNHVTNPFDANTSFVQLSNLQSHITDDVINIEIFRYNSSSANFSPFDQKVDSVTSVSITTGWRDELPISKEIAKNLKLEFNLPQQPDKSKIWLRVKSECDGSACRSTAIGSAFVDVGGDFSGVREATILNIVVGNMEWQIRKLKIFLSPLNHQRSVSEKEFDEKAPSYRWIVKSPSFGAVTCNITVQADLGPGHYRIGTILSTVFSVYQLHCLHWLDAYNGWQENLCKPHEDTVSGRVMCKCGHLPITRIVWAQGRKRSSDDFKLGPSLLGSKLLVFPNKLDYNEISSNMWQRFLENPIVFSMLFVLYSLYGLGLIWARSKDRQVEAEDLFVEVPDNSPFDKYRYIVTIFSGSRRNSGTSAVVCLRLVGKMATSSAHVIQHHTKILNRGSVKSFLITTSECLGDITAIRLWHDNGGHSPEWFLQRVVVRDLEKNHCWFFLCNRWFKHVIDHVVPAARTKNLHNTRTLFPLRLENHLRDRYLWYAFYGMRPWQRHVMGRIEMLSCCLMITLMIMLTALMFHGNNHAQQGLLLAVGNYTFQWWHVAVGIESALLSSPATFLITTMFRRSQRSHKSLLTDSKSVDDEESNVNDEQNPVSHHPNVADGSKEENLKLELFHQQLPVENKTRLRVKPNRETCVVEVAETSQHVMSEDRRVHHHHQRKEATGKMNQKEKRKLKKESPKTEHHDESKIHHRLKPYGENRAFEVGRTSRQVLNEEHRVHHHRRKESNKELDQKERRKLNKESPKKQHRGESKIHHKERLKWVKELLLQKQHRGESKSHRGVKPHGENPAIEVAGTSQQVLSEKHQVHHHQRKESNNELDQKVRRKLKKESPKKDHRGESKILSKVKHHGEAPAIEVADTSRHVLSEERRVNHHQRKEASEEMDHKPRQKLVKEFPKKQHRGESKSPKSHQGVKPHGENPAFEVTDTSRHDLIEDRRVYHHQRKEANDKMDKKERRKLKKEFLSKHHRGESDDFRRKSHQTGKRRHKHSIIVTKTARHVSSEGHSKHDAISQPQPSSGRVRFEEESSDDLKPPMRKIFLSSIVRDKDQPSTSSAAFVTSLSMPPRSPSIAMTSSQEPSTSSFAGMTSSQEPSTSSFVGMTSSQEPSTSSFAGMTSSQEPSTSSFVGMTSSQEPSTSSFVTEQVTPSARSHFAGQRVAVSGTGPHRGIAFVENDPNTGDSRVLPHFFIYIAWILLVATVLTSTVLCALYGMSYGIETCKEWLVSVSVAFLQSVIILEPLKEVLIAYVKVVNNPKLDLRDWIPPLPPSVTPRSHSGDCDAIKRKQDEERSRNRIYRPPSQLRVEITLQDIEEKIRTKRKIKNISLHLIFLVLLFIVTFGQTDRNSFQFGKTVQNMLLDGHRKMSSANDVYNWIEFSLADKFSIGRLTHFPDNQLLILTPPTLRQKRVIKGTSCVHSDSAFKYGLSDTNQCKLHYENQFQEKRNHGPTWSRPPTHATKPSHDVYESCWKYSTANTSWLSSYIGDLALFYNPGGYYVTISKLANETRDQVHYLRRFGWIDGYTRFLMLETVLYNVPHRIYCVTMVAIEISNTGNYVVKPQLMFMRSHHVERAWDVAVQVALYGILVLVLYHLVEVASGFLEEGFRFLKNLWNVLLLIILMTSTLVVGLYLSRVTYTDQAFQAYRNNMKSFHHYHMAAFTDYLTKCLLSICTFFTMLYTVKVMEGHPIFNLMHATIHRAKLEVLGLSLYIFFLYIAFCHVGLVLFGRSKDFSSVSKAMQSVVGFSMEAFTSTNLLRAYPIRGSIFLLLILFIFIKIFVNFFAAVLENTFRELKLLRRERLTRQHLMSFGRKHIRTVFTIHDEISERFKKLRSKRKVE
ncbi:unnamed protein product [Clavelina lepadiformis]|uniref:PLAT domain-containing protein n=1 Tax=Clavelina lepadiformis TaxID=159417 RepID=A0ABP0GA80_CLALP